MVFIRQVCEAMEFIHRNNILHLDLKPENILCLTQEGNRIKIIDFGLARKFDPDKKLQVILTFITKPTYVHTYIHTYVYMYVFYNLITKAKAINTLLNFNLICSNRFYSLFKTVSFLQKKSSLYMCL